ncbi:MAG: putative signal transducing protein [Chloroflexia bacterium]
MPYCPNCRKEQPEPAETCPDCGHLLLPARPVWRPFDPSEPLVVAWTAYGEPQAFLLKGLLEQEGIPVAIQREAGPLLGLTLDGFGAHRLLVPESLLAEAREILEAYASAGDTADGPAALPDGRS